MEKFIRPIGLRPPPPPPFESATGFDRRLPPFVALKSVPGRDSLHRLRLAAMSDVGTAARPLTRSGCSLIQRARHRHGRFDSKIFESAHHFRIESNRVADSNSNRISKLRRSLVLQWTLLRSNTLSAYTRPIQLLTKKTTTYIYTHLLAILSTGRSRSRNYPSWAEDHSIP